MMWGFYAWQPYFLELLGRDAVWVSGVVSALIALATIAGNGVVEFSGHVSAASARRCCSRRRSSSRPARSVWAWPTRSGRRSRPAPVRSAPWAFRRPCSRRTCTRSFRRPSGRPSSRSSRWWAAAADIAGPIGLGYLSRVQSVATGYVVGGIDDVARPPTDRAAATVARARRLDRRTAGRKAGPVRGPGPSRGLHDRRDRPPAGPRHVMLLRPSTRVQKQP